MKNTKTSKINMIFSTFLIIGYIICTYFFCSLASTVAGVWGALIQILALTVFGLLLFYATRVGDGKQVKRFSLAVLLLVDLPALVIILFSLIEGAPFHDALVQQGEVGFSPAVITALACVALGYGIPYTFVSGYELKPEEDEAAEETEAEADEAPAEEKKPIEGGLAEELAEIKAEEAAEDKAEEAAEETVEEAAEEATAPAEDTETEEGE